MIPFCGLVEVSDCLCINALSNSMINALLAKSNKAVAVVRLLTVSLDMAGHRGMPILNPISKIMMGALLEERTRRNRVQYWRTCRIFCVLYAIQVPDRYPR